MKIENLEDIINHFIAGNKNEKNIGIENEKFIVYFKMIILINL